MAFVKRNRDITLSIYSMQQFLSHPVLFLTVFYQVHLMFVNGSSHLVVFCKISVLEILNITRKTQCFVLKSLEFIFEEFFLGGQDSVWSAQSRLTEELSWLFCHSVFLRYFIGWVLTCSKPNFSFSLCLVTLAI